jgi:hypothetical protein
VTSDLRHLDLESLPIDEFLRRCDLPVAASTVEDAHALVTWFLRRYPTAQARFAYVRRARARVLRER